MVDQKYYLKITYDGTRYSGWQIQPNSLSIQETIEKALSTLLRKSLRIIGAGRTDAGVHAKGQVAHFTYDQPLNVNQVLHALNGMLPQDIRILELAPTLNTFHAQYSALSKIYHYNLWLEKVIDPFVASYRHHFHFRHFSLPALLEGTTFFLGQHDFTTFANVREGVNSAVRTLTRLDIKEQEGGIRLEFEGDGFLYKMVRNIVGSLLEISLGKKKPAQIPELLAAKDRRLAGMAAPAKGLFLITVRYPPDHLVAPPSI
jgi:tRNA pseudouridine38-40 synthase